MQPLYPLMALLVLIGQAHTATLPNYIVETYFVVEASVVQRYQNEITTGTTAEKYAQAKAKVETDIDYLIGEVNEIYSSLNNYGLSIEIRSRKIHFLDASILGLGTMDVDRGLAKFDTWLAGQSSLGQDVSVLWTAAELTSSNGKSPTGFAHIDGVCTATRASGIMEFDGTYHTAIVTAHEIAHILGANHDSGSGGYTMSSTITPSSERRWSFSSTTANAIVTAISRTSCLGQTNSASVALSGPPTKDMIDPDVICMRTLDSPYTFMCKDSYFYGNLLPKGDAICGEIYCNDPNRQDYCITAYPSDGMACGTNKVCNDGSCVADDTGSTADIDDDCVHGDQTVVRFNLGSSVFEGSCLEFLQTYNFDYCQQSSVSEKCCRTCNPQADSTSTGTGTDTGSTGTDTGSSDPYSTGTDTGSTGTDTGSTGTDTGSTGSTDTSGDSGSFGTSDIRPSTDCVDTSILCSLYDLCAFYADSCCASCSGYNFYGKRSSKGNRRSRGKRSADNSAHGLGDGRHRPIKLGHQIMVQVTELTNKKEKVEYQPVDPVDEE